MPYPNGESVGLQYTSAYDYSGGMVTNYSFARFKPNQVVLALNCDLVVDGSALKRKGRIKLNSTPVTGNSPVTSAFALGQPSGADMILGGHDTRFSFFPLGASPILVKSGLTAGAHLSGAQLDDYLFVCNGFDRPFMTQGTAATTFDVGIPAVTNAQFAGITVAATAGGDGSYNGALPFPGRHRIQFRYRSTITGARSQPNITGDIPTDTLIVTFTPGVQTYQITVGVPAVNPDLQVNFIDIFAQEESADSDAPYFFLGTVPNAVGVTSFGTNVSDNDLIVLERLDLDDLQPPTSCSDFETWQGRMMAITGPYTVGYSKQRIDDNGIVNLPTSWPEQNSLEVGFGDGDFLVKIIKFFNYIIAFKRRSIWVLVGDFDSANFGFRRVKTNYTNIGLLNGRCVVQAGDSVFFISDDLKFWAFSATDFSTEEIRLPEKPLSDPVSSLFTSFASNQRDNVNLVNYTWGQYSQILISFSDGSSGLDASNNFDCFVWDYNLGAWSINTKIEIASSVLARDAARNYSVYAGDYFGYVWQLGQTDGDGAFINAMVASSTPTTFTLTTAALPAAPGSDLNGVFAEIIGGTGVGQIRRMSGTSSTTTGVITQAWAINPDATSEITIGGIDFVLQTRWDWCVQDSPPDFDKYAWYLDMDLDLGFNPTIMDPVFGQPIGGGTYGFGIDVVVYINRQNIGVNEIPREIVYSGAVWDAAIWDVDVWDASTLSYTQVGLDLYFKQISVKVSNNKAAQPVRINGHTWCFQNLEHVRPT